ncbi:hypothetical protein [Methanobacterium bryantii]|uniref:Uncharacterized protein n=1 Tax=Methanobacterium bryantii TaxID=2161 RepID=A0A2A2H7S1_METBR|nr:hypothetical protein [Methanobacterium bryantii]PAV05452.1 hypothetical protein ASJ80_09385 [Methanobacterium bryantii]
MTKKQCKAITQNGTRCKNQTQSRNDYCHVHAYLGNKQYIKSLNKKYNPNSHKRIIIKAKDWDTILLLLGLTLLLIGSYLFFYKDNLIGAILGVIGLILTFTDNEIENNTGVCALLGLILFIGGIYQFAFKDNIFGFILGVIGLLILTALDNQSKKNN